MADSITIKGNVYQPINVAFSGGAVTNGTYWALPPLGEEPDWSGPAWNDNKIKFINDRTGIGVKRLNREASYVWADIVVAGTPAYVGPAKDALLVSLTALARYSILLPNRTSALNGCRLVTPVGKSYQKTIGSGFIARIIKMTWEQLSDEN